jgi:transposase
MSRGYSQHIVKANVQADKSMLGVLLGRACIKHGISASTVAEKFGVSRQTVYNWFGGYHEPSQEIAGAITSYIKRLTSK